MDLEKDKSSFRLEPNARSFRPYDFGLGDVPWIMIGIPVAMVVLGGLGFFLDRITHLLPPLYQGLMLGTAFGFLVGLRVGNRANSGSHARTPLKP